MLAMEENILRSLLLSVLNKGFKFTYKDEPVIISSTYNENGKDYIHLTKEETSQYVWCDVNEKPYPFEKQFICEYLIETKQINLPDTEYIKLGYAIVKLFDLKPIKKGSDKGRYNTTYGTKTVIGIGATVARILEENIKK